MGSQPPYDPYIQSLPSIQPTQSHEYEPAAPFEQPTYPPVNPYAQQNPSASPALLVNDVGGGQAIAGLILGIISMLVWLLPLLGFVVPLVGLVFSALGRRSLSRKGLATAGLVLSVIGLVLAIGIILVGGVAFYHVVTNNHVVSPSQP